MEDVKEGFQEEVSLELSLGGHVGVRQMLRAFQVTGTSGAKAWGPESKACTGNHGRTSVAEEQQGRLGCV